MALEIKKTSLHDLFLPCFPNNTPDLDFEEAITLKESDYDEDIDEFRLEEEPSSKLLKFKWDPVKEKELITLIQQESLSAKGKIPWKKIADKISQKFNSIVSSRACQGKFNRELSPDLVKGPFVTGDLQKIKELLKSGKYFKGKNIQYKEISKELKRPDHIIRWVILHGKEFKNDTYFQKLRASHNKNYQIPTIIIWNSSMISLLLNLVESNKKPTNWTNIASQINKVFKTKWSRVNCRDKFEQECNPNLVRGALTEEEREKIKNFLEGDFFEIGKGINYIAIAKAINRTKQVVRWRILHGEELKEDPFFQKIRELENERIANKNINLKR